MDRAAVHNGKAPVHGVMPLDRKNDVNQAEEICWPPSLVAYDLLRPSRLGDTPASCLSQICDDYSEHRDTQSTRPEVVLSSAATCYVPAPSANSSSSFSGAALKQDYLLLR